jgi:hypothetical protein
LGTKIKPIKNDLRVVSINRRVYKMEKRMNDRKWEKMKQTQKHL